MCINCDALFKFVINAGYVNTAAGTIAVAGIGTRSDQSDLCVFSCIGIIAIKLNDGIRLGC